MSFDSPQNKTYDHSMLEFLKEFGTDLTTEASEGRLSPIVGRKEVVEMMIQTLCRSTKSNPVLIGPAGVVRRRLPKDLPSRYTITMCLKNLKTAEFSLSQRCH